MDNIKISIILPVFNEEKYIKQTLDSLINQDFTDFEVIVVDDGSTDSTLQITEKTLKNSSLSYKIIHQENSGVSSARNKGIHHAEGEYIVFLDGDDYVLTNHLTQLYNPDYDFTLIQLVKKENNKIRTSRYYNFK